MTNQEVSAIFTDIYNGFWMKHRDNLPLLKDKDEWDILVKEGKELMDKHDCQLASDMIADLLAVMDQRQREQESERWGR